MNRLATIHSVTDRLWDRGQDYANTPSYCVLQKDRL